ncbi:U-box domain-containing protein 21-like [Phalaenopsis equestris]|uniref:U-box domain-containing protein 21-like n=1 Tax=Phalaenopsis equestris TaxID=78828 RepID=UPI0009E57F5B|nr:U-box domain-containing protein 21-like [Phalaenopsis equestris]
MAPPPEHIAGENAADVASTSPRSPPLTAAEASSILSQLTSSTHANDLSRCRKSAARVRVLAAESNRNRRRFAESGAASVLAAAFRTFATSGSASLDFLSEILSALVLVYPADDGEVFSEIGSPESLHAIASILRSGNSTAKLDAVLVLKQIVWFDGDLARAAALIDGLIEILLKLILDPISPRGKKAAQLTAFHLAACSEESMAARFVRMGVFSLVIESLVDSQSEKRVSEAALSALDRLCGCELGREKAYGNALTVPVLVKKIFGFSDMATELAVSSLLKLCKNWEGREKEEGREGGCVVEALQVGVFVKLLMLLQVEGREKVKERATELLRFLNDYGKDLGCVDSRDFRGLRRPV